MLGVCLFLGFDYYLIIIIKFELKDKFFLKVEGR